MRTNKGFINAILIAAVVILAGVAAYFIVIKQSAQPITDNQYYYYVPELRLRFINVSGITPLYNYRKDKDHSGVDFYSSVEIIEKAKSFPNLKGCIGGAFGWAEIMVSKQFVEIKQIGDYLFGHLQKGDVGFGPLIDLKNDNFLIFEHVQDYCLSSLPDQNIDDVQNSSAGKLLNEQQKLFSEFLNSAEQY